MHYRIFGLLHSHYPLDDSNNPSSLVVTTENNLDNGRWLLGDKITLLEKCSYRDVVQRGILELKDGGNMDRSFV